MMADPRLTPLQAQMLVALAQPGAYLLERWGGAGLYLCSGQTMSSMRWSVYIKLARADYLTEAPRTYPHEYRLTPAGQQRAAALMLQEATLTDTQYRVLGDRRRHE